VITGPSGVGALRQLVARMQCAGAEWEVGGADFLDGVEAGRVPGGVEAGGLAVGDPLDRGEQTVEVEGGVGVVGLETEAVDEGFELRPVEVVGRRAARACRPCGR